MMMTYLINIVIQDPSHGISNKTKFTMSLFDLYTKGLFIGDGQLGNLDLFLAENWQRIGNKINRRSNFRSCDFRQFLGWFIYLGQFIKDI